MKPIANKTITHYTKQNKSTSNKNTQAYKKFLNHKDNTQNTEEIPSNTTRGREAQSVNKDVKITTKKPVNRSVNTSKEKKKPSEMNLIKSKNKSQKAISVPKKQVSNTQIEEMLNRFSQYTVKANKKKQDIKAEILNKEVAEVRNVPSINNKSRSIV